MSSKSKQPAQQPGPRRMLPLLTSTAQASTWFVADTRYRHVTVSGDAKAVFARRVLELAAAEGHAVLDAIGQAQPRFVAPNGDATLFLATDRPTPAVMELLRQRPAKVVVVYCGAPIRADAAQEFTAGRDGNCTYLADGTWQHGTPKPSALERGAA